MPTTAITPPSPPLAWDGRARSFLGPALLNALLTLPTLGIWRFWGRSRIRRIIWSHLTLFGDRLEYTGTGGELFRGVIRALLVLGPLFLLPAGLQLLAPDWSRVIVATQAAIGIGIFLVALYAVHGARRYLASRTTWRGLRFAMTGRGGAYLAMRVGWFLATMLTLGLAYPWAVAADTHWMLGRLRLGSEEFGFDGRGRQLLGPLLLAVGADAAIAVVIVAIAVAAGRDLPPATVSWQLRALMALDLAFMALLIAVLLGPGRAIYRAAYLRWRAAHTTLAGARFSMPGATAWRVWRLSLGNWLIIAFSLTILSPVATARTVAFHARHLRCDRDPDLSGVLQVPASASSDEGFLDLLGSDAFAG